MELDFKITGDHIELNKLLKASGVCGTGGESKMIIKEGLVRVDGEPEKRVRRKIKAGMVVKYSSSTHGTISDTHTIKIYRNI